MPSGVTVSGQDSALGRPACVLEGQNSPSQRKEVTDGSGSGRTELGTLAGVLMPQAFMARRPGLRPCAQPRGARGEKDRPSLNPLGVCSLTRDTDKKPAMAGCNMSLNTRQVPERGGGRGCLEGFMEEGAFQTKTERGAGVSPRRRLAGRVRRRCLGAGCACNASPGPCLHGGC